MASTQARKFAQALLKILEDEGSMKRVEADLRNAQNVLDHLPSLGRILSNPGVESSRKSQLLDQFMGQLDAHPVSIGAMSLLVELRKVSLLPELIQAYRRQCDEKLGVTSVKVTSAKAIDETDRAAWEKALSRVAGTPVRIDYETDPSLIGGAVARVGSVLYDGSIRTSLQKIRQSLLGD